MLGRKPLALMYAVLTAWRTWVTALVLAGALVLVVQPLVQYGIRQAIPPLKESKLLGLVKREKPRAAARTIYRMMTLAAWIGVGGLVVVRFRRQLPDRMAAAGRLARAWEREADGLTDASAVRRRRLYRAALLMALDPVDQERLKGRVSGGLPAAEATAVWGSSTRVESTATEQIETVAHRSIGPEGRYLLVEKLGEGAMGVVYRGRDQVLDRPVALKQLAARLVGEAVYLERFRLEARALARLSHPHIVQVFDLVTEGETIWMVLEYVEGGTLAEYLKGRGCLTPDEAARMIGDVADGLAMAHRAGIIHRDIKPANILLTADGRAKLSDFGIAKLASEGTLTQAGTTLGSPAYMSPEQCNGETPDGRSDIYSLGITLYEVLAGQPPFAGDTSGILAQHMVGAPRALAETARGVPAALDRLVMRMLAKRREDRPQGMGEVAAALRQVFRLEATVRGYE